MDLQYIINLFGRWYNDQPLSPAEADFIPLIISTCTVSVLLVVMLIWMAHLYQWGTHIKWFTEDLCHWFGWNIGSYNEKEEDQSKTIIHTSIQNTKNKQSYEEFWDYILPIEGIALNLSYKKSTKKSSEGVFDFRTFTSYMQRDIQNRRNGVHEETV